jgi:diguanylate cyclase (GGDEF)-like protein
MADLAQDIGAQLDALRTRFLTRLQLDLDDLERMTRVMAVPPARASLDDLHQRLHKLAGAGGTFGFPSLSSQARYLEHQVKRWLDGRGGCESDWAPWVARVAALRGTLTLPATQGVEPAAAAGADSVDESPATPHALPHIHIIGGDSPRSADLLRGLRHFGYAASHFTTVAEARAAIVAQRPDALIVDINQTNGEPNSPETVCSHLFAGGPALTTLVISAHDDFEARLAAAQAGAIAYFVKPVDIPRLVERLDQVLRKPEQSPYRILIIDDDAALAGHFRLVLMAAGMEAVVVNDPRQALEATQRLQPDLILMDVHMPLCSGPDLARTIRLQEEWVGIPIVYLSVETDLDEQLKAMDSGADDFLTKPIADHHLVAAVKVRAARARQLSDLMARDSLTGLLKHSRIKEQLAAEVARAIRQGTTLSVAMIDMDHFKSVNDSHGHSMGDRVIKALAQLLRQRLRQQDSLGRYGGEEFVAILPDCGAADAERKLDDIRERFRQIRFGSDGREFSVTLSAGIATTARQDDPRELLNAADAALYEAKHGGRDRVCLAGQA